MKSFVKKDSILKIREISLKKNLKKEKNSKIKLKKKMTVLSDKWIKKAAQKGMINLLLINKLEREKFLLVFHLMVTMQEFQMNLRYLLM